MKKDEYASISLKKIMAISLILIFVLGLSVLAGSTKPNSVKIRFSNNHEITVVTSKTKVADILEDNHIILLSNEIVSPGLEEEITDSKTIKISFVGTEDVKIAETIELNDEDNVESIKQKYENITEAIVTIQEEIPFETITKDVSSGDSTVNKVIQAGKNGLKETTYKITYQSDVEIAREELESKIIEEPVNKIVQLQNKAVATTTSRSGSRTTETSSASGTVTFKVTAYCSCSKCCGKSTGITASGTKATANHTIAAPSTYAFGTQIVMNGVTYTVEDRGGAIQGNRIDVYVSSHSEALSWGVKYVTATIY